MSCNQRGAVSLSTLQVPAAIAVHHAPAVVTQVASACTATCDEHGHPTAEARAEKNPIPSAAVVSAPSDWKASEDTDTPMADSCTGGQALCG